MILWVLFPDSWYTAVIWLMQLAIIGCFFPLLRRKDELWERALTVGALFTAWDGMFLFLSNLNGVNTFWIKTVGSLAFSFFVWTACTYVGMRLCERHGIDYWGFRTFAKGRIRHVIQYIGITAAICLYSTVLIRYSKTGSEELAIVMDTMVRQTPAGILIYVLPGIQYEVIERGAYLGMLLAVFPRVPGGRFAAVNIAALLCTFGCIGQLDSAYVTFLQIYPVSIALGYLFLYRGLLATASVVVMTSVTFALMDSMGI